MTIDDAIQYLSEKYHVDVTIEKENMFVGYKVKLISRFFVRGDGRHTEAVFYEVVTDDWRIWCDSQDKIIREKLSIF